MSDYSIIDRRKNPKGKNLPNRQRFLKRVKKYLGEQIKKNMKTKSITNKDGADISIPNRGITEPNFDYDTNTGHWERILPGNKDFVEGDRIPKPQGGQGGSGNKDAGQGSSEDDFEFTISKEEYLDLVFEDLELPDLIKKTDQAAITYSRHRAGYQVNGNPSQLDLIKSLKNSMGRRLALKRPNKDDIKQLEEELELLSKDPEQKDKAEEVRLKLEALLRKKSAIAWVDPIDIRYKRFEKQPIPYAKAVIFCLMDVSASMEEREKEIAKRFYLLLYLFLQQKYKKVDIVFIRHAEEAWESTEEEFFYSTESGGTKISSGLTLIENIIKERYDPNDYNIYVVQASDGDNFASDNEEVEGVLNTIMPLLQYYVYLEIKKTNYNDGYFYGDYHSSLWYVMSHISTIFKNLKFVSIDNVDEVVSIFRHIFHKDNNQ